MLPICASSVGRHAACGKLSRSPSPDFPCLRDSGYVRLISDSRLHLTLRNTDSPVLRIARADGTVDGKTNPNVARTQLLLANAMVDLASFQTRGIVSNGGLALFQTPSLHVKRPRFSKRAPSRSVLLHATAFTYSPPSRRHRNRLSTRDFDFRKIMTLANIRASRLDFKQILFERKHHLHFEGNATLVQMTILLRMVVTVKVIMNYYDDDIGDDIDGNDDDDEDDDEDDVGDEMKMTVLMLTIMVVMMTTCPMPPNMLHVHIKATRRTRLRSRGANSPRRRTALHKTQQLRDNRLNLNCTAAPLQ